MIKDRIHQIKTLIRFIYIWARDKIMRKPYKHRLFPQGRWWNYGMPVTIVKVDYATKEYINSLQFPIDTFNRK